MKFTHLLISALVFGSLTINYNSLGLQSKFYLY